MIKLASPDINEQDIARAVKVIKSERLIQGSNVKDFETQLTLFTGIQHAAVVSSGTAALHLSLLALGVTNKDAVVVPAFTFPATANVVEMVGAELVLAEVEKHSYVMTPGTFEEALSKNKDKNIKAVIVVHEFGFPAQIREITEIAKRNKLFVIEDSACALGTIADGYHVGYFSDLACFSFHPRKAITTGEGGAVLSSSSLLREIIISLRNHGQVKYETGLDFIAPGLNYRMTDFQAALALGQLKRFNQELDKRKKLAYQYIQLLQNDNNLQIPCYVEGHSWQSFMIVLGEDLRRPLIVERLAAKGIETNLGAYALNCLSYYMNKYRYDQSIFKIAAMLYERGLVLPIYGKLQASDVEYISESLLSALEG